MFVIRFLGETAPSKDISTLLAPAKRKRLQSYGINHFRTLLRRRELAVSITTTTTTNWMLQLQPLVLLMATQLIARR